MFGNEVNLSLVLPGGQIQGTITGGGDIIFTNSGNVGFNGHGLFGLNSISLTSGNGALTMRSGSASNLFSMSMGRFATELEIAVVATATQFAYNTSPGDVVIRNDNIGNSIVLAINDGTSGNPIIVANPILSLISTPLSVLGSILVGGNVTGIIFTGSSIVSNSSITGKSLTITLAGVLGCQQLTGSTSISSSLGIGRISSELELGIAAGSGQFSPGSVAGDAVIRNNNSSNAIIFSNTSTSFARIDSTGISTPGMVN